MPLAKPYQSQPTAVATYNYTDIAEGTGVIAFNAFSYSLSGSTLYGLTSQTPYSSDIEKTITSITTAYTKLLDLDFDLTPFNLPKTIKGKAIVTIPFKLFNADADKDYSAFVKAIIKKGAVEIASAFSSKVEISDQAISKTKVFNLPITLDGTLFKKGEILRLTIELWGQREAGSGGTMTIGIDPANRDGAIITKATDLIPTKLEFYCPFKLDL